MIFMRAKGEGVAERRVRDFVVVSFDMVDSVVGIDDGVFWCGFHSSSCWEPEYLYVLSYLGQIRDVRLAYPVLG
jgi:hypothetical protein